ncbi:MAG: alpha-L-fucosidase [Propionibacteriaceae bacterium]|jgi:hypothetical protein|nr:alpha-L-fucosidase [Propionibacteriaceae bacterium]
MTSAPASEPAQSPVASLVLRQIHLDFHNSAAVQPIADLFDAETFARVMSEAHVNSVNIVAKCLHGFSYYPTQVGVVHPGLSFDLFGAQLAALQSRGIKAQAYVTVLWDDEAAKLHPEWVAVAKDGSLLARPALSNESGITHGRGWSVLDLASEYTDYVLAQVEEICQRYAPDGFWFDIVSIIPNYSPAGVLRMQQAGVDVSDDRAVEDYYHAARDRFLAQAEQIVRRYLPNATVAHNQTTDAWLGKTTRYQTQIDVESLPTDGAWGYLHYPVMARYARTFGLPIVGMTGRFHLSWADFGGLKTVDQLAYEIGTIWSAGGSPCVGDQLDPSGVPEPTVYAVIGKAFERAEALAGYLGGTPLVEAAVVAGWRYVPADAGRRLKGFTPGTSGAAQMLLEQAVLFDIVDAERLEPGKYALIVVPDDVELDDAGLAVLQRCREAGAKLLSAGTAVPALPGQIARSLGPCDTQPSFFRPGELAQGGPRLAADFAYVTYGQAAKLEAAMGACLGAVVESRFNRTWDHFTSHGHAPVGATIAGPLVVVGDDWAHLAVPAFSEYAEQSYWATADTVAAVIGRLLPERLLTHEGPRWIEATAHRLPPANGQQRTTVHLTAYQPRRSSSGIPRMDTTQPVAGFPIRLRASQACSVVELPEGTPVPFSQLGDLVELRPETVSAQAIYLVEHA